LVIGCETDDAWCGVDLLSFVGAVYGCMKGTEAFCRESVGAGDGKSEKSVQRSPMVSYGIVGLPFEINRFDLDVDVTKLVV
jgi:hypothetical protein